MMSGIQLNNICFNLYGQGAVLVCLEEEAKEKSLWRMLKWLFSEILLVKIFYEMTQEHWGRGKWLHP